MNLLSDNLVMLQAIEDELQHQVDRLLDQKMHGFHEILTYQLGWTGDGCGPETRGKRIRPLLVLFSASACGANWQQILPAAASVELIHNFSLIHDDIQDNSDLRRGRITVWKKWGSAQGINAGDALFAMSNLAILELSTNFPVDVVLNCASILHETCLDLTIGQFLDMSYEKLTDLTIEEYWVMIKGKTAALLSASCLLGALLGGGNEITRDAYRDFGHYLGLAFQVQDDLLGIWGDTARTGKSTDSDLVSGKKTLPVLFGLQNSQEFSDRWKKGSITIQEVPSLADLLAEAGAFQYTQETADKMTNLAFQSLRIADPQGEAGDELFTMVSTLLNRDS